MPSALFFLLWLPARGRPQHGLTQEGVERAAAPLDDDHRYLGPLGDLLEDVTHQHSPKERLLGGANDDKCEGFYTPSQGSFAPKIIENLKDLPTLLRRPKATLAV